MPSPVFDLDLSNKKRKKETSKINPNGTKLLKDEIVSAEFDNIWNSTNLMPQIEENNTGQLPTIGEEFSNNFENKSRTTLLGGKVAKINTEQTTQVSYNVNKDLENLRKIAENEQKKTNINEKKNFNRINNDNLLIADEY